jgi:hypothetical protein
MVRRDRLGGGGVDSPRPAPRRRGPTNALTLSLEPAPVNPNSIPNASLVRPILITSRRSSRASPRAWAAATAAASSKAGNGALRARVHDLASKSTQVIAPEATVGNWTAETYQAEASEIDLPDQWLSEAEYSTAEIEARRAARRGREGQGRRRGPRA